MAQQSLYGNVTKTSTVSHFLVVATGECLDAKKDVLFGVNEDVNAGTVFTRDSSNPVVASVALDAGSEIFVSKTNSNDMIASSCGTIAGVPGGTASIFVTTEFVAGGTAVYVPGKDLYFDQANKVLTVVATSGFALVGKVASLPMVEPAQKVSMGRGADRTYPTTVSALVATSIDPGTELPILAFTLNATATLAA